MDLRRETLDPELRAEWDHAGLASGHAWARCDVCGEEMMLPRDSSRRCALSFGCAGTMRVPPDRPTPLQALRSGAISVADIRRWPPVLSPTLRKLIEPLETEPPEKCPTG